MEIIKRRAYARAGLLGNPSDGYNGKTISCIIPQYYAEVVLYEWEELEILACSSDQSCFDSIFDLARDVRLHGYYGGVRLVKATIKKFVEFCQKENFTLHDQNFSIRYTTNIPRQVGMAGSSAIIVATLRALMAFYQINIPKYLQPSLVLSVEQEELGITAGLQDRVIQVYEGLVYMDFSPSAMTVDSASGLVYGHYEPLTPPTPLPLYVSFKAEVSEPTEVFHNNLRARYQLGETSVVEAMTEFASLAAAGREAILSGDYIEINRLMNANFDLRRSICRLPEGQVQMIDVARQCGASAKFAGSGGAIVGLYNNTDILKKLKREQEKIGSEVILI